MSSLRILSFCILALSWPRGCQRQAPPEPPPPTVTVVKPEQRQLVDHRQYTGRIEAVETVDVRARVRGYLGKVYFREGTEVKKGDLLYEIDPRTFQAELNRAQADVTRLKAQVQQTGEEAQRARRLVGGRAIGEEEYDKLVTARNVAQANLTQAEAAVRSAELELSFTKINAPITGRIGRTRVTEGNLVGSGEPTLLTTIVRADRMFVYFDAPERDYLEYQKLAREQKLAIATDVKIPVHVGLVTDEGFPRQGIIDFRDNRIEAGTGTIRLRGELPNPDRTLLPGLFARVRVPVGRPQPRLLVPEQAIQSDQRGRYLLVVRADDTVEYRPVTLGAVQDDLVVIEKGIGPDDRVIVNGLQRARPGGKVSPQSATGKTAGE